MIITEFIDVTISNLNKKHYEARGYITDSNKILRINIKDLTPYSHLKVEFSCDYCGEKFFRQYSVYTRGLSASPIKKDACKKCAPLKTKESNNLIFGVDNVMQVEEFKNNNIESVNIKYGVDNVFQLPEIQKKSKETMMGRYGVEHNMYVDEFVHKANVNRAKSLYKNGSTPQSKQQSYIHKLIGGESNYPVDKLNLDIAFLEDKIYLEYNGGGHDLSVKMGNMNKAQFRVLEIKRYKFLKTLGWKQIVINSPKDYLPQESILLDEINLAISFLKEKNSKNYYNINIGCSIEDEKYGTLQRIV